MYLAVDLTTLVLDQFHLNLVTLKMLKGSSCSITFLHVFLFLL